MNDLLDILATPGVIGLDFETTVDRAHVREVCTVQVAHSDGRAEVAYIYGNPEAQQALADAVTASPATLTAHFAIFEMECLLKLGARPRQLECTYIASRVLHGLIPGNDVDPGFSLDDCAYRELGVHAAKDTRDRDWREPLDDEAIAYCLQDAILARDVWLALDCAFDPRSRRGYEIIRDALPAIAQCNLNGLVFDVAGHTALCVQLQDMAAELLFQMDLACEGAIKNHQSNKEIGAWIAWHLSGGEKICSIQRASMLMATQIGRGWKLTASGQMCLDQNYVTQILDVVRPYWPRIAEYLSLRAAYQKHMKLLQAFGPNLRDAVDADGHLRGSLIPHGARTSRQSCRNPNLQQMPAEDSFRAMFRAAKGRKIVQADYAQIELVVGSLITGCTRMQDVFRAKLDIHSATAAAILGIPIEEFDRANPTHNKARSSFKPVTFSALYGAQATTVAMNSGLGLQAAEELLDKWLDTYPEIRAYRDTQPARAKAAGYAELVSGQRIATTDDSRPAQLINAPVQGSAASVMYRALTRVEAALQARPDLDVHLALCVHDEILLDAAEADADAAALLLSEEMTRALCELYPEAWDLMGWRAADACVVDSWAQKDQDQYKVSRDAVLA